VTDFQNKSFDYFVEAELGNVLRFGVVQISTIFIYPPASEASREVANFN
jgi:hypothetical protein